MKMATAPVAAAASVAATPKKPRAKLTKVAAVRKIVGVLENLTKDTSAQDAKSTIAAVSALYT